VLKLPDAATPSAPPRGRVGFRPSLVSNGAAAPPENGFAALEVPILGAIAAGSPIEAIQSEVGRITAPIDPALAQNCFALQVRGDSMIQAGILDGDVVVLRRGDSANNGDVVVALIDQEEATLKRLRRRGNSIALEAANPAYETRIFGPDRVQIQGKLVALIRRYV
jgi:repressor LexA